MASDDLRFQRLETTDAGTEQHGPPRGIDSDVARLFERFRGRRECDLREAIGALRLLRVVERGLWLEVADSALGCRLWCEEPGPERLATDTAGREDADAGDGDPSRLQRRPHDNPFVTAST